jgi:uncharacterized membrane protein
MPGIFRLSDIESLRAFKEMDRIIQNNHPLFIFVWAGSLLSLLALGVTGFAKLEGLNLYLALFAVASHLIGIQLPTMTINVPINNKLQMTKLDAASSREISDLRNLFEGPWVKWNNIRTVVSFVSLSTLILLAFRI